MSCLYSCCCCSYLQLYIMVFLILAGKVMRERNNVDKDNFDGLQINQNWIWKKTDEVEQDGNETIAILTEHDGFKTILKVNKAF